VKAGQLIGFVGDSGNAAGKGAHLHIGIGTSIKNGAGPEGGAGVPWPGNNCNRYLQHVLDVLGSDPVADTPAPPAPPAEPTLEELKAKVREQQKVIESLQIYLYVMRDDMTARVRAAADEIQRLAEEAVGPKV
jgi:hypothetical protein